MNFLDIATTLEFVSEYGFEGEANILVKSLMINEKWVFLFVLKFILVPAYLVFSYLVLSNPPKHEKELESSIEKRNRLFFADLMILIPALLLCAVVSHNFMVLRHELIPPFFTGLSMIILSIGFMELLNRC